MRVTIAGDAALSMAAQARKWPSAAVSGLLLGRRTSSSVVSVERAVHLSHSAAGGTAPLLEIGIMHARAAAQAAGLDVIGAWAANEVATDFKVPAATRAVAQKLSDASIVVLVTPAGTDVFTSGDGFINSLDAEAVTVLDEPSVEKRLRELVDSGKLHARTVDLEEHLDDVSKDWLAAA